MLLASIRWAPFRIAFREPFRTAADSDRPAAAPRYREGVMLEIQDGNGSVGYGEASPLPERGEGTAQEVVQLLTSLASNLLGGDEATALQSLDAHLLHLGGRALACAIETALLDAQGRTEKRPVAALLSESGTAMAAVPVNATIGDPETQSAAAAASRAVAAGFTCVKLKVGAVELQEDLAHVAAVRAAMGRNVRLRLDANGAWSAKEAVQRITALAAFDLEWVEQPTAADDLDALRHVRAAVDVPIAADESVRDLDTARRLVTSHTVDALVLKPISLGGLRRTQAIAALAASAGLHVVITTGVDAGIGTAAALHLAAALSGSLPACGLATASLLADDLLERPLGLDRGAMPLPISGGLGVEPRHGLHHRWHSLASA